MRNRMLPCLLLALAACDGAKDERSTCPGPAGSITDLAAEPGYSATYLHRWSLDGCPVRLDVLMSRDAGCGPRDLLMGSPLGAVVVEGSTRIFVGGDTGLDGNATGYKSDATLPPAATDTGFRQGVKELWAVPDDDAFVFIRSSDDGRTEAWPLYTYRGGCI